MVKFLEVPNWDPGYVNTTPQHIAIMAECTACGELRNFSFDRLPESLQYAEIRDVEKLLKCSECGAKAGKLRFGSFVPDQ
jgi:hypothetical protein